MDTLQQVLRLLHIKPTLYFRHAFSAPWGMEIGPSDAAQFHIVVHGHCLLRSVVASEDLTFSAGDIVVLPHGTAHALLSSPDSPTVPGHDVLAAFQNKALMFQGTSPSAELVCGHFDYSHDSAWQPLLRALPDLIHVPAEAYGKAVEATTVAHLLTKEMEVGFGGDGLVAERLAEALFVLTLRAYLSQDEPHQGFLAAIRDPRIGKALALIHGNVGSKIILDDLVQVVGMSRSAFANRFKEVLGLSPMAYAEQWRLLRARDMLRETRLSIADVAVRVGYESAAAFHRAFKREFGNTPSQIRKTAEMK